MGASGALGFRHQRHTVPSGGAEGKANGRRVLQSATCGGFRLFCDFDLPIGHITPMVVWPSRTHGFEIQWVFNGVKNPATAAAIVGRYASPENDAVEERPCRIADGDGVAIVGVREAGETMDRAAGSGDTGSTKEPPGDAHLSHKRS